MVALYAVLPALLVPVYVTCEMADRIPNSATKGQSWYWQGCEFNASTINSADSVADVR